MPTLTLLGDSIIDNGAYVAQGEPDVATQIAARLPGWHVDMRAVDGNVTTDVTGTAEGFGDAVFVSTGGNDALGSKDMIASPAAISTPYAFAQVLSELHRVREVFRTHYVALAERLEGRPVMVATIYNPRFDGVEAAMQIPAEAGLSAFNDVIQDEALARGFRVLELRRLFTLAEDYANPIEPSAIGGAKIADAVAAWCHALQRDTAGPAQVP